MSVAGSLPGGVIVCLSGTITPGRLDELGFDAVVFPSRGIDEPTSTSPPPEGDDEGAQPNPPRAPVPEDTILATWETLAFLFTVQAASAAATAA